MPADQVLQAWITSGQTSKLLGAVPANFYVKDVEIDVTDAFNAGTTNTVSVGYPGSTQAFCTSTGVGSTGSKAVTLGSAAKRYQATGRDLTVYFSQTGTAATAGKALVRVTLGMTPPSP